MDPKRREWLEAIRHLVREASDEQLAGMTGADRRFYSDDAVDAAEAELQARREAGEKSSLGRFNVAALGLGPFWYLYNGMVGRGLIIAAILVAAAVGLQPVARALEVPTSLWVVIVVVAVALYCGFFFERDLTESRSQAERARPKRRRAPKAEAKPSGPKLAVVAQVGCREAAEHARALLRRAGIDAIITSSSGSGDGDEAQTRLLVREDDLLRARSMVQSFLSSAASECAE
jgi:hypothetical protein